METRNQNSLVETNCLELASCLVHDLQLHHPALSKDLEHDLSTLKRRTKEEGLGFLMHALPRLGKALYRALETGTFECPLGFRKKRGTVLPRFLSGLLTCIFDSASGRLREDFCQISVTDVTQLCFTFYKLDLPCAKKLADKVIRDFVKVEQELSNLKIEVTDVIREAQVLCERVLKDFDPREITPRHGPGAVATGERFERKWSFKRKYESIHAVYPYYEYYVPTRKVLFDSVRWYKDLVPEDSGCAKVKLVPKDSRGPRLISMEPLEYQFVQQGLGRALMYHLETRSPYTRKRVNFTDQGINQNLALWNSASRSYSTLDMKEASDRVSMQLVELIFARRPDVLKALIATRTTRTELPNGTILPLRKFAPMGSALCFPVEAFVFWLLATVIKRQEHIRGVVYVYGDDIIVPRDLTTRLFELFPKYGLKFNEDKCFTQGYFRESCGCDAYKGVKITPTRMRKVIPWTMKQAAEVVGTVELSNSLYMRGYWKASQYLRECLSFVKLRTYKSPSVNYGGLSYSSFTTKGVITEARVRYKQALQNFETFGWTTDSVSRLSKVSSFGRLFECLTNRRAERYTVPHAVQLKMRWITLYG